MSKFTAYLKSDAFLSKLPQFLKSTAIQQGIMIWLVSLVSLAFVSSITVLYVEHELDKQNFEIFQQTQNIAYLTSKNAIEPNRNLFEYFDALDIDDDPIDDDEITEIMTSGFMVAGMFEALFTALIVYFMSRFSQQRIRRIEEVLGDVSDGKLDSRTGVKHKHYDLARVSVSVDEMLSRLEGSVSAMSDISANIAHELKTPITRLRHNLLNLRDEATRDKNQSPAFLSELDQALDDSMRLASIFDALLRISQIESGARRSRFTEVELSQVIETVSDIYCDVAEDQGMSLKVRNAEMPIRMQGDRELLIQQVVNLIENALRYCDEGSSIRLSYGADEEARINWIRVEDNGPGIPSAERERVFERLYRVDKSRTDGGLGLGLSFAKAVAGLHHGQIYLYDCQPGLGVKIEIPFETQG